MEKKKINLGEAAAEAGKGAAALFGKAKDALAKAADQTGDGTFDKEDMSVIAENVSTAAKSVAAKAKALAEETAREAEKRLLRPIFSEDLDAADFHLSKLIRITDIDKRRAESEVCQGSIGFVSTEKELEVINIFRGREEAFELTLYPDDDSEVYYVDPSDRNRYIALDEYFYYLKIARVNELQKIAQDLGAKHFRVTYKEQKTSFSSKSAKAKATVKTVGNVEATHDLSATEVSTTEVAAEMDCPGHDPVEPTLLYLQKEPSIQSLITLRMDPSSPMTHQIYTLKLSNSSGIKEKDAVKIDGALKAMKISGNMTVTSEVQNESRRFFEYEVDF